MRCYLRFLPLLMVLLIGCQAASLQQIGSSGMLEWSGPLSESTVWSRNVLLRGPVEVPQGIALTIQPGSVILFQQNEEGQPGELIVNGTLYAEGGEAEDEHIVLASVEQLPENWAGIRLGFTSAGSRLSYSRIFNAQTGILAESSDLSLEEFFITGCTNAAITCAGTSFPIEYSQIQKNRIGIECRGDAAPIIRYNDISTNDQGIVCTDNSRPEIRRNNIQSNLQEGVWISPPAFPIIEENNITRNGRWAVYGGGKLVGNFLQGNNKAEPFGIDTSTDRSGTQYYDAEEVTSPRQARVSNAGPYRRQ